MSKYSRLQILKHALEYYVQRPNATPQEIKEETAILKDITNQVNQFKEQNHVNHQLFKVTHAMGDTWEFECSGEKAAKRRAFKHYKKECPYAKYPEFLQNIKVKLIH